MLEPGDEQLYSEIRELIAIGQRISNADNAADHLEIRDWIRKSRAALLLMGNRLPALGEFNRLRFEFVRPEDQYELCSDSAYRDEGDRLKDFNFHQLRQGLALLKLAAKKLEWSLAPQTPSEVHGSPSGHKSTSAMPSDISTTRKRRHGPAPRIADYQEVTAVVARYAETWKDADNLKKICREFDLKKLPAPKAWRHHELPASSWREAWKLCRGDVVKAIEYRLKAAKRYAV